MAKEGIAAGGVVDINTALQDTGKTVLIHDDLAHGIHKGIKALGLGVAAHACNVSIKTGGSGLHGHSWLHNKFEASLDSPSEIDITGMAKRSIQRLLKKNQNKMSLEYCIPTQ